MEESETSPQGVSPELEPAPVEAAATEPAPLEAEPALSVEELMATRDLPLDDTPAPVSQEDSHLKAILEAIVYVAEEPLTLAQIAASLLQPVERIQDLLNQLIAEFDQPGHGVSIREVAGGYKMATKPEHHEAVRNFVKSPGLEEGSLTLAMARAGVITSNTGPERLLELAFDGNNAGESMDFRPDLPLVFRW